MSSSGSSVENIRVPLLILKLGLLYFGLHYLLYAPCGSPNNTDSLFPHSDGKVHIEGFIHTESSLVSTFAIQIPPTVALPVAGTSDQFPVRRVYCIGRNYAAHAIEMGHDPDREPPFFFQKNPDNLDTSGEFPYPPKTTNVHHEIEMAVMLKSGGTNIPVNSALDHVFGYALSLDMTRRDLQSEQKKMGRPWEIGKAFERSAPVGEIHTVESVGHLDHGRVELKVNGAVKQEGDLNQMIWKVPEMISYLSNYFEIAAGDVILSGTPAGVGPIVKGDVMDVSIEWLGRMSISVV